MITGRKSVLVCSMMVVVSAVSGMCSAEVDYLEVAVDFADCMIEFGRDRYGEVHSPLFAVLLTRDKEPRIGPYPLFKSPSPYDTSNMNTPFKKFDFNKVLNYPSGLGGEGPHKVTFYGCDPFEDRDLYYMLADLTRITGDAKYKNECEKALRWWFANTQGPGGLYAWGEHLGKDPGEEAPGQSIRLARHCAELSVDLAEANHEAAVKLRELALLHLGEDELKRAIENLKSKTIAVPAEAKLRDLSQSATPNDYAVEIIRNIEYYTQSDRKEFLQTAETFGEMAYTAFCDNRSPLPKAHPGLPKKTAQGTPFGDFYFKGAKLMGAFALLAEAKRPNYWQNGRENNYLTLRQALW